MRADENATTSTEGALTPSPAQRSWAASRCPLDIFEFSERDRIHLAHGFAMVANIRDGVHRRDRRVAARDRLAEALAGIISLSVVSQTRDGERKTESAR